MHKLGWLFLYPEFVYWPDMETADAVVMVGKDDDMDPWLWDMDTNADVTNVDEEKCFQDAQFMADEIMEKYNKPVIGIGKYANMIASAFFHPSIQFSVRPAMITVKCTDINGPIRVRTTGGQFIVIDKYNEKKAKVIAYAAPMSQYALMNQHEIYEHEMEPEIVFFQEPMGKALAIQSYPHLQPGSITKRYYAKVVKNFLEDNYATYF